VKNLNHLQMYQLDKFCRKHDLDTHLIDRSLTYFENKAMLKSQVVHFDPESHMAEFRAQREEYDHFVREHFLVFYLDHQRRGETTSTEVGEQDNSPPQFSLSRFVTMRNQRCVALRKKHKD